MRVIVCGSRDWENDGMVNRAIGWLAQLNLDGELVLVHGDAKGADRMTDAAAEVVKTAHPSIRVEVERHPADWDGLGKRAGYARNVEMAKLGADLCLAFTTTWPVSTGTNHMVQLAYENGIPVRVYVQGNEEEEPPPPPKERKKATNRVA